MNKVYFILVELVCAFALLSIPFEIHQQKKASELIKYTIVIDPGHGGKDNGCCSDDVYEDEINLEIAKALSGELISQGFMVYLTRDGDYDLASDYALNRKNEDLKNRVKIVNSFETDILISLHVNYYNNQAICGPMVYYRYQDDASKHLAEIIQNKLNEINNLDKVIHSENFYLFRNTTCLALLIECGFISNPSEKNKLITPSYQSILAHQISQGVISYLKDVNK